MPYVCHHTLEETQHNVEEEKEDKEKQEDRKFCGNTCRRAGVEPDSDLHRSEHFVSIFQKFEKLVQPHIGNEERCQEASLIMREGNAEEIGQYIHKLNVEAQSGRKHRRHTCRAAFIEQLLRCGAGGGKLLHQVTKLSPWRG